MMQGRDTIPSWCVRIIKRYRPFRCDESHQRLIRLLCALRSSGVGHCSLLLELFRESGNGIHFLMQRVGIADNALDKLLRLFIQPIP